MNDQLHNDFEPRVFMTVRQFSDKHPAWSQASLRNLLFYAKPRYSSNGTIPGNGLDIAVVRVGRKLLIDEQRFFEWLSKQNGGDQGGIDSL